MGKMIKKQFGVQWKDWSHLILLILGIWILGVVLHYVIVRVDDTVTTYFSMGTLMAMIGAVFAAGIMGLIQIGFYFNMEISMGCTRKGYFISYYITALVFEIFYLGIIVLLNLAERVLEKHIYTGLKSEVDFLPYILKWGLLAAAAVCVISGFCGTLLLKYGKKAFWVLWCIWMFGCLVLPKIRRISEDAPNSFLGKIGNGTAELLKGIPVYAFAALTGAAILVGLGISWQNLRKQQVTS